MVETEAVELRQVGDPHEPPRADDPHLVADVLDLGEDVRREEYRGAAVALFAQQAVELLLVQRVEPARGLVEDEQVRRVHEGEDDAELLLVAARVLAKAPAQVQVEPVAKTAHTPCIHTAPHAAEVRHDLLARHAAELWDVARQVADALLDLDGVAHTVDSEDVSGSRGWPDHPHYAADGRGLARAVRSEVAEDLLRMDLKVELEQAVAAAVVLGQARGAERCDRHGRSI